MYARLLVACTIAAAATLSVVAAQPQPPSPQQGTQQTGQPQQPTAQPTPQPPVAAPVGTSGQMPTPQPTPGSVTQPGMVPAPMNAACPPTDVSTALPLLDRMQRLLDDAIKDGLGKVSLDRGSVDELRAEVAQVRAAIAPVK